MDLAETEDEFVLKADLPGLSEDDVSIELEDNVLTVSGERKGEHEERKDGYYRVERSYGRFSRSLTLPEGVDADAVKASFDHGVLEVHIPKPEAKQAAQGRDLRRRGAEDDRGLRERRRTETRVTTRLRNPA